MYLGDSQENSDDDMKILAVHSIDSSNNSMSKVINSLCSSLTPKQKNARKRKGKKRYGKMLTSNLEKDSVSRDFNNLLI